MQIRRHGYGGTARISVGEGIALFDPHGDLADKLLDQIPPHRVNDVVYYAPPTTISRSA